MAQIFSQLGIQWQFILVMAVGFVILWFILSKFAFGPVTKVLEDRTNTIQRRLDDAEQKRVDMQRLREDYERRIAQIEEEARQRIQEAMVQAQAARDEMLAQAREQSERIIERGKEEIAMEMQKALVQFRDQVADLAILVASKVIEREMDESAHRELIDDVVEYAVRSKG